MSNILPLEKEAMAPTSEDLARRLREARRPLASDRRT